MKMEINLWRLSSFLSTITFFIWIETYSASMENTAEYQWDMGQWESCATSSACGEGIQTRKTDCVSLLDGTVVDGPNCGEHQKPVTTKSCFLFCDALKPFLRWAVGSWSKCHHRKHKSSNCSYSGISHRTVKCLYRGIDGMKTVPDTTCEKFWSKPEERMPCSQECPQDCLMSEGTCKGSVCSIESPGSIIVAPESGGLRCPFVNITKCNHETCLQKTTFPKHTLKVSDWGPCMPIDSDEDKDSELSGLSLEPKIGKTTRVLSCHDRNGKKVNISHCPDAASEKIKQQRCLVPKDCELSPWSEWTVTVEGCVNSRHQIFPETRVRTRKLVLPALGNGAPCGPLYEERTIRIDLPQCYKYQWFPLDWKECVVYTHKDLSTIEVIQPTCGGGVQVREIICLQITGSIPVAEFLCVEPKPPTVQRCDIPCIRDCQVSQWSKWGPCLPFGTVTDFNKPIQKGFQMRTRSVIVSLSSGGASCPHLQEIDTCVDVSVARWIYGNWSECHLLDRSSPCGPGEKNRDYSCVTFKGEPISAIFCEKHASYRKTTEACRIPCPDDCVLSQWSDWSSCPSSCSDKDDEFHVHRNRTSLAIKGPDGSSCHSDKKESRTCTRHSCSLTRWSTSDWDECQVHDGSICGYGVQKRRVICQTGDIQLKNISSCSVLDKPDDSKPCEKHCPEDCILTNFTEWSPCPIACSSGESQRRRRFVQRPAKYGGRSCSINLNEERPCPAANDVTCNHNAQPTYTFRTGNWKSCTLPDINSTCGAGFQFRGISCVDDALQLVEMHSCLNRHNITADIFNFITTIPSAFRLCQITCRDGQPSCVHSAWTSWSSCPYKYKAKRSRTRELVGSSESDPYCVDRFTLIEQEDCPFFDGELAWSQTSWSSCILEDSNRTTVAVNDQNILHHCGAGYRYKTGLQVKNVDIIEPGLERDLCLIDCPVDCKMSEWSEWSACDVSCGRGYRQRRRRIVIPSNDLGRPCPSESSKNGTEIQQDVCDIPCNEFHWLNYGWSKCELLVKDPTFKKCGNGTQTRTVECISKRSEETVDSEHCDPILKPTEFQLCTVPCPGECIVSEWSTSTDCSQPCNPKNSFMKKRLILRQPASQKQCPELVLEEPCILNGNCFEYNWEFGEWASCILPEGAVCGEGVQKRVLLCRRSDSRQVDTIYCKKFEESPSLKHELSKPCLEDCPIDCVLSHWSSWNDSQCVNHCGTTGMTTRSRFVLQPSSESGQPCSSEMEQKKPCPFKPCYHWKTFDWSACDLQGASCGYGVRRRLVRCIRYDGLQVDKIYCLSSNLTFGIRGCLDAKWLTLAHDKSEEEDCYIRCPGDCILGQWSSWGHCHRNCDDGQEVGYQTSSRSLLMPATSPQMRCPTKMWKTKPCWGGDCTTFKWKYENDTLTCVTAQGVIVKGGCKNIPRPCFKSCELLPGGNCNTQKGTCFCKGSTGRWVPVPFADAGREKCYSSPPKPIMGPKQPANHTAEINRKYYPDDSQVSFWMYAMISIGSAFVIFVVVTIYLMCRSSIRQRMVSVQRQSSFRRRGQASPEKNVNPNSYS